MLRTNGEERGDDTNRCNKYNQNKPHTEGANWRQGKYLDGKHTHTQNLHEP